MELFRLFGSIFLRDEEAQQGLDNIDKKAGGLVPKLGKLGAIAGTAGMAFGALGVAVAGAVTTKSIAFTEDMQKALNGVAAETGATSNEMKDLKAEMLNIYKNNFGENFEDIAQSMAEVKKQSKTLKLESSKDIGKFTESAILLRDTFEFDVNTTIKSSGSLVQAFGIDGQKAMNLIAQAAQKGGDKSEDLLDSLNEYAPQFAALGFSAEKFAETLIAGAESGAFMVDKAGDAIKEFNIRAKDGSKGTSEAYKELGLDAKKMTNEFAAGGIRSQKAFELVSKKLIAIKDPVKLNTVGVQLFGTQFEDLEAKGLKALLNVRDSIDLSKNALDGINKIKYATFGEAMEGIKRQLETKILLPLGEKILPKLNELANWFMQNSGSFEDFSAAIIDLIPPEVIKKFEEIKKVIVEAIGPSFKQLGESFKAIDFNYIIINVKLMLESLKPLLPLVKLIAGIWVAIGGIIIGALNGIIKSIDNLIAFVMNLYGVIASIWGLIISLLTGDFSGVRDSINNLFKNMFGIFVNGFLFIKDLVWGFISGVITYFTNLYDVIVGHSIIPDMINAIINWFKSLPEKVMVFVINFVISIIKKFNEFAWAVKTIFLQIKDWILSPMEQVSNLLGNIFGGIVKTFKNYINNIISGVNTLIKGINKISFTAPDWVPAIGGKSFGINIPTIPKLAKGGIIKKSGMALVGEKGPELLSLAKGATVQPLMQPSNQIIIDKRAFEGAFILDDYGVDKIINRIANRLTVKGIYPR